MKYEDLKQLSAGSRIKCRLVDYWGNWFALGGLVRFVSWPWFEMADGRVIHANTIIEILSF